MAGWISSKLKVAETLLQQIDQQAAESLRKGEQKQSDDGLDDFVSSPKPSGTPPLRDQLLKKKPSNDTDNFAKLRSDSANYSENKSISVGDFGSKDVKQKGAKIITTKPPNSESKSSLKDSDWTELLNTPKQPITATKMNRPNGIWKDGRKPGLNVKGNGNGNGKVVGKMVRKVGYGNVDRATGAVVGNDTGESREGLNRNAVEGLKSELRFGSEKLKSKENDGVEHGRGMMGSGGASLELKVDSPLTGNSEGVPCVVSDEGKKAVVDEDKIGGGSTLRINRHNGDVKKDVLGGLKSASHPASDHELESESDSDSSSASDSGDEREREEKKQRRRQILAAKAAAKAAEAIKEQENVVARLEGEKQSLEKILEEQANQAQLEASELQSMMMEMMEATELEKQKHNHTRMEVLARMAKLETANANLAKSLATAQWNLQIEVNHLAELRKQVDVKQVVLEELRRKKYGAHQSREISNHLMATKGLELQKEMLEAECAFATDKIARLQEKGIKLEEIIERTLKEMENPTEVEVEIRRRLHQMTDHLIQKQAQVESLSSDKATLFFRIEAVSRLLDENKSLTDGGDMYGGSRESLESCTWESSGSKLGPMLENKIKSGRQHIGSLVRQLDAIFSAGAAFLARNPAAKLWSLVYLVSLHLWVVYILSSHSQSTEDSTSSSVVSLKNVNGSFGV